MESEAPTALEPEARHTKARRRLGMLRFIGIHMFPLGAIWSGVSTEAVVLFFVLYAVRMFGVTAGYHRYFSHRSFKTSRAFQLVLAVLAQTSAQQGTLWWAAHHRHHHRHSDGEADVHSPRQRGVIYSHMGWVWDPAQQQTRTELVRDLARYPELVWLNRRWLVPATTMGVLSWVFFDWSGLFFGFGLSTVLAWHCTFTINSLAHMWGTQPYDTGDDSRNNLLLALLTFGEGWHNNHHEYMMSTRQGFRWWQIDLTWYVLVMLSWVGLVWDLRAPPERLMGGRAARG